MTDFGTPTPEFDFKNQASSDEVVKFKSYFRKFAKQILESLQEIRAKAEQAEKTGNDDGANQLYELSASVTSRWRSLKKQFGNFEHSGDWNKHAMESWRKSAVNLRTQAQVALDE